MATFGANQKRCSSCKDITGDVSHWLDHVLDKRLFCEGCAYRLGLGKS